MTQMYLDVSNQVPLLVLRNSLAPVKAKAPVGSNGLSSAVSINWDSSACTWDLRIKSTVLLASLWSECALSSHLIDALVVCMASKSKRDALVQAST